MKLKVLFFFLLKISQFSILWTNIELTYSVKNEYAQQIMFFRVDENIIS